MPTSEVCVTGSDPSRPAAASPRASRVATTVSTPVRAPTSGRPSPGDPRRDRDLVYAGPDPAARGLRGGEPRRSALRGPRPRVLLGDPTRASCPGGRGAHRVADIGLLIVRSAQRGIGDALRSAVIDGLPLHSCPITPPSRPPAPPVPLVCIDGPLTRHPVGASTTVRVPRARDLVFSYCHGGCSSVIRTIETATTALDATAGAAASTASDRPPAGHLRRRDAPASTPARIHDVGATTATGPSMSWPRAADPGPAARAHALSDDLAAAPHAATTPASSRESTSPSLFSPVHRLAPQFTPVRQSSYDRGVAGGPLVGVGRRGILRPTTVRRGTVVPHRPVTPVDVTPGSIRGQHRRDYGGPGTRAIWSGNRSCPIAHGFATMLGPLEAYDAVQEAMFGVASDRPFEGRRRASWRYRIATTSHRHAGGPQRRARPVDSAPGAADGELGPRCPVRVDHSISTTHLPVAATRRRGALATASLSLSLPSDSRPPRAGSSARGLRWQAPGARSVEPASRRSHALQRPCHLATARPRQPARRRLRRRRPPLATLRRRVRALRRRDRVSAADASVPMRRSPLAAGAAQVATSSGALLGCQVRACASPGRQRVPRRALQAPPTAASAPGLSTARMSDGRIPAGATPRRRNFAEFGLPYHLD